jgi:hypothetical protein
MNADAGPDTLPSWREGRVKARLLKFGSPVSTTGAPAYDRASRFGLLDKGLDLAQRHGWCLVSLRRDWDRIFPCSAQD